MSLGSRVSIRPYKDPRFRWIASYKVSGKLRRKYFKLKKDALAFKAEREEEAEKFGAETYLGADDRLAVAELGGPLEEFGWTVRDALTFSLEHLERVARSCTVEEGVSRFLAKKSRKGVVERTYDDYVSRLGIFARAFHGRFLDTITAAEMSDYLRNMDCNLATKINHRRILSVFFNTATRLKMSSRNPAKEVDHQKLPDREIGILSPGQAAALLENADESIVGRLALAMFAGIRRAELDRLDWRAVSVPKRLIRVSGDVGKGRRKRQVPISDNLIQWLQLYGLSRGKVTPPEFVQLFLKARKDAGIEQWPANGMRHSYASYRLQETHDAPRLALEMGNSVAVILKNYHQLVDDEETAAFWSIVPVSGEKVKRFGR